METGRYIELHPGADRACCYSYRLPVSTCTHSQLHAVPVPSTALYVPSDFNAEHTRETIEKVRPQVPG